ncbi:MAG: hypothetical protein LBF97_06555 [Elusimicrobiota bacterium]|jgi:hypothetical protein|nr:hypothetical protein [Elusimicrobiota bacterium]
MDYEKNYNDLINKAKNRIFIENYEKHHILPKSMGGIETVNLTFREHYLAHYLLWKIYKNKETAYAFHFMNIDNKHGKILSSRMFEKLKKEALEVNGSYHKGKILTEEHKRKIAESTKKALSDPLRRKKMSDSHKREKNANFGKNQFKNETIENREKRIQKIKDGTIKFWSEITEEKNRERSKKIAEKILGRKTSLIGKFNPAAVMVENIDTGEIFNTLKEAAEKYNLKSSAGISQCCNEKQETAGGFHWKYHSGKKTSFVRKNGRIKNLDTGEIFQSANCVVEKYGMNASSLYAALGGKRKTCYGFHWKYIE